MKVYLVGGAVRDELMGLPVQDRDWVVVNGSPQALLDKGYESVGKHFPVFLHPDTKEEYALARIERKIAGGYHGFEFDTSASVTLEEDLKRRDLTINAIAKTTEGVIIDPYGGQRDLKQKVLRHVSEAFAEDPVRVLRVARFAARYASMGFTVAPETQILMKQMVQSGECDFLVAERVWTELEKALGEKAPVRFIQTLRECGALARILPECDRLYGVPQSPEHHPEIDTGVHLELVLEQACRLSDNPMVRFAALTHDLGKGLTSPSEWPKHPQHELVGTDALDSLALRLKVPNAYYELAYIVMRYHGDYHRFHETSDPAFKLALLERLDLFRRPSRMELFLLACLADFRGRPGYETKDHPSEQLFRKAYLAASGVDVKAIIQSLNTKDGSDIKEAIRKARCEAIIDVDDDPAN